jgi:hypothetical protein
MALPLGLPNVRLDRRHFVDEPSIIVFKENETYYALDAETKAVKAQGPDAATVMQQAVNALTYGGKIFLKRGTYVGDITIDRPLMLLGEGRGDGELGLKGTIIDGKITVTKADVKPSHVTIADLVCKGLDLFCYRSHFRNLAVEGQVVLRGYYDNSFEDIFIRADNVEGLVLNPDSQTAAVQGNFFHSLKFRLVSKAIKAYNYVLRNYFYGIEVSSDNLVTAIELGDATHTNPECNWIFGLFAEGPTAGYIAKVWGKGNGIVGFTNSGLLNYIQDNGVYNTFIGSDPMNLRFYSRLMGAVEGVATIKAGDTYVDITHNLNTVKLSISITPLQDPLVRYWADAYGYNAVRISIQSAQTSDLAFRYSIRPNYY